MRQYRVIQWATGTVGRIALRQFIERRMFVLAGVFVTNPDKVGMDAGQIAQTALTGIAATDDVEAIVSLEADCVHFAPATQDIPVVCRLLRSGKNVVSPLGPFYPSDHDPHSVESSALIGQACAQGGTSFYGCGVHPGFVGDLLPLVLARAAGRIDHIHVTETIDFAINPSPYLSYLGFGRELADLRAQPARSPELALIYSQSMAMVIEALGKTIERMETRVDLATALEDIPYCGGTVRRGTVAGQHYAWTAIVEGRPLMTFHSYWMLGSRMAPAWDTGPTGYAVRIEGEPGLQLTFSGLDAAGQPVFPGLSLTGLLSVNAIPAVCQAPPGIVTHKELGLFAPLGLLR